MKFSPEFMNNLKKQIDMKELAGRFTELTSSGKYLIGRCPHPKHNDSSPSFRVVPHANSWFCGGCHNGEKDTKSKVKNYGSDPVAFISWMFDLNFPQAVVKLCEMYGIELERDEHEHLYRKQELLATSYHANLSVKTKNYLHRRGLTDKTISKYRIGYNGIDALTIPLLNRQGSYVGFTNRYFHPDRPKYKNSPNSEIFYKSNYLFGSHLLDNKFDEIRITEGAFDHILPTQYGVKNVVATLGTAFTEQHAEFIHNLRLQPVFIMDGDDVGRKALIKAAELMAAHNIISKVLILSDKTDLADLANLHKQETESYIQENAIYFGDYLIQKALKEYESKITELNLMYLPVFKSSLALIKNTTERKVVIDRIYRNTGLRL